MGDRRSRGAPGASNEEFDRELDLRGIVAFGIGLGLTLAIVLVLMWLMVGLFRARQAALDPRPSPMAEANAERLPPEPRLQSSPTRDMEAMRAAEDEVLRGYGWVDRQAGIGRIPIDRAIEILAATDLPAEAPPAETPPVEAPPAAASRPLSPARDIGFDQRLGEQVPLDLEFRDETGATVRLGDYFGTRPVLLSLAYYRCPMLCGMALEGIASSLKTIAFDAGKEFEVVTVSFDPSETPDLARSRKERSIDLYGRPSAAAGWHFLTGGQEAIGRLTSAVGFRYVWDADLKQYAHPTGLVVLTPRGRIARYFFGIEYAPKDLRLGLIEAATGRIGSVTDRLLLLCYQYDPKTGRYSATALGAVRIAGALTVLCLGAFIAVMLWRERRKG